MAPVKNIEKQKNKNKQNKKTKMNEHNNINRSNNENSTINIDKRMLPLFSTPVQLKKLNDQKINKYNLK